MKRRRPPPDLRPDWRDLDMPVLVSTKSQGMTEWTPERVQKVALHRLQFADESNWRDDPTYNLRKPK